MKTKEYLERHQACEEGARWASQFEEMSDVWEACERVDWLIWILIKEGKLGKEIWVELAVGFSKRVAHLNSDPRAEAADAAAERWIEDPSEENRRAAGAAADAASAAGWAAGDAAGWAARAAARAASAASWAAGWAAADAAAYAADAAGWAAADAADAAADAATEAAERKWQADFIKSKVENPFKE